MTKSSFGDGDTPSEAVGVRVDTPGMPRERLGPFPPDITIFRGRRSEDSVG